MTRILTLVLAAAGFVLASCQASKSTTGASCCAAGSGASCCAEPGKDQAHQH